MYNSGVFIFRSPSDESLDLLRDTQEKLSAVQSFRPVEAPHVTLLSGQLSANLSRHALRQVISPLPESAERSSSFKVESTVLRGRRVARLAVALHLEDTDGLFYSEHETFARRLAHERQQVPVIGDPHVTLGHVDPEFAISQQLAELTQDAIGASLQFKGIELSHDMTFMPMPPVMHEKRIIPAPDGIVRTLKPGTIPAGFLSALQASSTKE